DHPLREWIPDIDAWLAEMIRLEGRGEFRADCCPKCHANPAIYRCQDCQDLELYCKGCSLELHRRSPLHRISAWVTNRFKHTSLKSMGLRIQLGHTVGNPCVNPISGFIDGFVLIDLTGIHIINIDFCGCEQALSCPLQLLRARIFPATSVEPRTGATFRVLEHFHIESTQAATSAQAFYNTLARRTDNTGLDSPQDRYSAFLRIMRKWRYLKFLKRGGRGHEPGGAAATGPGELALLCPACPHPGKNLPLDWENAPPWKKWLYRLFIGIDGNFRLKRRKVSSTSVDPCLTNGQAYFVEDEGYKSHIKTFGTRVKEEKNTCNNHDAATLANVKGYKSLSTSGVVAVQCTRHEMHRPCSVGDLQRGERYVNVDYVYFTSMKAAAVKSVIVSYDIACQWSRKFWNRVKAYGPTIDYDKETTFLIPKFHLPAHQSSCQDDYSFNLTKKVAKTDGEGLERGWAITNDFGPSTKEMGPGARHDTLNDGFGAYNWRKIARLPITLLTKAKRAAESRYKHAAEFQEFNAAIPAAQSAQWASDLDKWEHDPSCPNPFTVKTAPMTQAAIHLKLAQEEATEIEQGRLVAWHGNLSPSSLIVTGLEIEEQHKVIERRNVLQRKIEIWADIQKVYISGVDIIRSLLMASSSTVYAESYPLLLPSEACAFIGCNLVLLDYEWQLREGQAHGALDSLRRHLRLRTYLCKFKGQFVSGQRPTTWARSAINNVQQKVDADMARYRAAHSSLISLSRHLNKSGWQTVLRPLEDDDVRGISDGQIFETESHRTISWIWKTPGISPDGDDSDPALHEALRIEWCKSRARADRWSEECELLQEEMRRVTQLHKWTAAQWIQRAAAVPPTLTPDYAEGQTAYAMRQADIRTEMSELCTRTW
ncbi:hypothetical protein CERSUDRAFT_29195, partial [Gelatoporia subvermispora B]